MVRLNPQPKNLAHRDNQGFAHFYPRDMAWYNVCSGKNQSNEQGYMRDHQPCGVDSVLGGKTMKHPSADTLECCSYCKHTHINQDHNN